MNRVKKRIPKKSHEGMDNIHNLLETEGGVAVISLVELELYTYVEPLILGMKELADEEGEEGAKFALSILKNKVDDWPKKNSDDVYTRVNPIVIACGGFGASACPSLSHNPLAREMYRKVYDKVSPEFAQLFPGRKLEFIPDRFSIRRLGTSVNEEEWHRDVGAKQIGDIIYGGWVNLDPPTTNESQWFSCLPKDIIRAQDETELNGFEQFAESEQDEKQDAFDDPLGNNKHMVEIPPGHMVIFNQTIAHTITGAESLFTSYRQYFGWRITDYDQPLYDKKKIMDAQIMPPLPSGQLAPMYPKLYAVNYKSRLKEYSKGFKPIYLDKHGYVKRFLPGLVESNMPFDPYTEKELDMYYPQPLGEEWIMNEMDGEAYKRPTLYKPYPEKSVTKKKKTVIPKKDKKTHRVNRYEKIVRKISKKERDIIRKQQKEEKKNNPASSSSSSSSQTRKRSRSRSRTPSPLPSPQSRSSSQYSSSHDRGIQQRKKTKKKHSPNRDIIDLTGDSP